MTSLRIVHLYPALLKTYGDRGNVQTLLDRARWRGIDASVTEVGLDDDLPQCDLLFMGGGTDRIQAVVAADLQRLAGPLRDAVEGGAVVVGVCGGYQLMGRAYEAADGSMLEGLGLIDAETRSGPGRLTGDVVGRGRLMDRDFDVVGFENHGGRTILGAAAEPLIRVQRGNGNNGEDGGEGAVQGRVIGTYLHGPVLPLNPDLADLLLAMALGRDGVDELGPLDDAIERRAHDEHRRRRIPRTARSDAPRGRLRWARRVLAAARRRAG